MTKGIALCSVLAAAFAATACTVHQADTAPPLTGPSGLAQSVTITATPDSITRDGQSQSAVVVRVIDASGQPAAGVALRMDIFDGGSLVDFGTLAARTIVTGSDGRATTAYTAPPAPPTSSPSTVRIVTISATPVGGNAQTSPSFTTDIRLMPQGVILPPAGTPTASFSTSPGSLLAGVPANFDASASLPGSGASSIVTYAWSFGDGTTGTGRTTTHAYASANNYNATLTVTNDRGVSASITQAVTVGTSALPTPIFNFSPAAPGIGETVFFNASASTAAPGRTIASHRWAFGDGGSATGSAVSHVYQTAGTYVVTLTVTDDLGQSATTTQGVTVGNPPAPTAKFTFSPTAPLIGESVLFAASTSTTAQGQTITDYFWNFGDDPSCPAVSGTPPSTCYVQTSSPTVTHQYTRAGTFTVNLVVRDSAGRTGSASTTLTVGNGNPVPVILVSPASPVAGVAATLNGTASTAAGGETISSYVWSVNGPGLSASQSGSIVSQTFPSAGSYTIRLTVTDTLGRIGTTSITVNVVP
jgi:PKD repeat protein